MLKSLSLSIATCLYFAASAAQAQNLFILPGSNSLSTNVGVVAPGPFTNITSFTTGTGPFQVLATPSGSKYYVIANSGSATVTVLNSTFSNARSLGNLGLQATAAAITPNGNRLLVAAGTLHIYDTATDNDIAALSPGSFIFDVVVSLDGTRAFALGRNNSGGSTLYSIDLSSNNVVSSLPVLGTATAVSVGPNSYVYVSTLNQVIEVNPNTLAVTPGGIIALNANPGKVVFTPDGKFGLAVNQTPNTGSSVVIIDLAAHNVFMTIQNGGVVFDRLFVAGNNLAFAYSSQTQSLYTISIVPAAINPLSIPGVQANPVLAAGLSSEVAGGSRTVAQSLYLVTGGILYRYDLTSNTLTGQLPVPQGVGIIATAGPANITGAPATILQYGNSQVLALGAQSAPLVVRVLDSQGLPVGGVPVTFSTSGSVPIQNPTVITSPDGFAVTSVVAPSTNQVFTVSAGVPGGLTVNFNLSAGSSGGPGGGGSAQLSIVAGQGQILYSNFNSGTPGFGSPLIVQVKDVSGNPVANATVTFAITAGPGSVSSGVQGGGNGPTVMVTTDTNGIASASFLSTTINPGSGYQQTTVAVGASGTNTVTFFVTTTTQQPAGVFVQFNKPAGSDVIVGQAGSTVRGAITAAVVSITGPVPNVSIRIISKDFNGNTITDPSQGPFITCADPTGNGVLSDMNGFISCDVTFGPKIGMGQFVAEVGYNQQSRAFPFTVVAGQPSMVKIINGNNQTGLPGQTLPSAFLAQVTDAGGNVLSGVPVTFTVSPAGAVILTNQSAATDANGNASALGRLGNIAGPARVTVSAGGNVSATFSVNVIIPVVGLLPVSGGGQSTLVSTPFAAPLVIKVTDANGNGVGGAQVAFAVTGGSASLGTINATTDASGQASTTVVAGPSAGAITITATSNGFSTSFALSSRLAGPTNVTFVNGASFQTGIAPGAIVTISGNGIVGSLQGTVTPNSIIGPLPPTLAGVQILFNGISAPIYSVSNVNGKESVTVQVPFELQPGTANVTINAAGGGTATINNVPVMQYSPGVFETLFSGQKYAVAIRPDGSFVSPTNPVLRGEIPCLFATGLGQLSPAAATNSTGVAGQNVLAPLDVGVNNSGVRLVSATYLTGLVGVYEVCFEVPIDATGGPGQPIGLVVHDASGNTVFAQSTILPIQ